METRKHALKEAKKPCLRRGSFLRKFLWITTSSIEDVDDADSDLHQSIGTQGRHGLIPPTQIGQTNHALKKIEKIKITYTT